MSIYDDMPEPLKSICDGTKELPANVRAGFDRPCNKWVTEHWHPVTQTPDSEKQSLTATPASAPPVITTPLLGDAISSALSAVGITEERVSKWLGKPCGCGARKEKINNLHRWFAGDKTTPPVME